MKKIIIGMLLLLPLIIVASVLFAIDIITVEAYIAIERVELSHTKLELDLSERYYNQLVATVYPMSAKNKTVIWTIENVIKTVDYDGDIANIDKNGHITLNSYGTFKVVATTEEGNKKAVCDVYVKGDKVTSVKLSAPTQELKVGESAILGTVFEPLDAIVKDIKWQSDNPSAIKVDQNGIITALGVGKANISVKSGDAIGSIDIISKQGMGIKGNLIYVSADSVPLSSVLTENVLSSGDYIINGGDVENGILNMSGSTATINIGSEKITIEKCLPNEIVIEHKEMFEHNDFKLRWGKLPLQLTALYRDSFNAEKPTGVVWSTSDDKIATVNLNGVVSATGTGTVVLTATTSGQTASVEIKVIKPVSLIVLDINEQTEKRGIAERTIYGNKRYQNGVLVNEILDIGVLFPQNADVDEFIFSTDNAGAVFNTAGRLTLNGDFSTLTPITIKVVAKEAPYAGIEISVKHVIMVENGVNCYNYQDVKTAVENRHTVYLQNDIAYGGQQLILKSNLYGNGYTMDGSDYDTEDKEQDFNMLKIMASGVTLSNVTVRNDNAENISKPNGLKGYVVVVGDVNLSKMLTDVMIEYSILENGYYCVDSHKAEYTIKGSILRNTSNFGINIMHQKLGKGKDVDYDYSDVTLNNVSMSNIVAPAIGISSLNETNKQSSLKVKGFLDMYNWQQIDAVRMIERDLIKGNELINTALRTALNKFLSEEFAKERYDGLRYEDGNTSYLHLGIITAGALYKCTTVPEIEDSRIKAYDIEALYDGSLKPIIGIKLSLEPCILYNYDNQSEILPGDELKEDADLYKRLRGE